MKLLDKAVSEFPEKNWQQRPKQRVQQWSVGEIMHHLILVEVQRLDLIKALLDGGKESLPPREGPAPDISAARRAPRQVQALPEMMPKAGLPAKVLRAALRQARRDTLAFAEAADLKRLAGVWLRTASLGVVNAGEYLELLAAHMERHADQVVEIAGQMRE